MLARGPFRYRQDRKGATAIEYALLASLSSILALAAFMGFGDGLAGMYTELTDALSSAMGG
ncbi:Flp family type IVb pilin [Marinimicrococcus flavescens]|uniref:Flp family type IVb pilin n=1 Tax=Marinimicrococcus flavescens TaxID=3031815 RepID=A0AAP3XPX4_9PROT|nr:Flp family type IVb pilin [Marinimicrococcus flavescens]